MYVRGEGYRTLSRIAGTGVTLMVWIVVIVSMVLIYCTVRGTEKRLRRYGHGTNSNLQLSHRAGIQAILYIVAFMMSYIFLVLVQLVEAEETGERTERFTLDWLVQQSFSEHCKDFFNAIIFFRLRVRHLVQPGRALAFVSSVRTSTSVRVPSSRTGTSISNSQVTFLCQIITIC